MEKKNLEVGHTSRGKKKKKHYFKTEQKNEEKLKIWEKREKDSILIRKINVILTRLMIIKFQTLLNKNYICPLSINRFICFLKLQRSSWIQNTLKSNFLSITVRCKSLPNFLIKIFLYRKFWD